MHLSGYHHNKGTQAGIRQGSTIGRHVHGLAQGAASGGAGAAKVPAARVAMVEEEGGAEEGGRGEKEKEFQKEGEREK